MDWAVGLLLGREKGLLTEEYTAAAIFLGLSFQGLDIHQCFCHSFSNDIAPLDRLVWVGRGGSLHVNMTSFSGCHFSVGRASILRFMTDL
jgi:hypothetical protein